MSGDDSCPSLRAPAREAVFRPLPLASPSGPLYIERMFLFRVVLINQITIFISIDPYIPSKEANAEAEKTAGTPCSRTGREWRTEPPAMRWPGRSVYPGWASKGTWVATRRSLALSVLEYRDR